MFINEDDLRRAQDEAKRSGIFIGAALIKLGVVDEAEIIEFLSEQYGVPAVDPRTRVVNAQATGLLTREDALKWLAIPVERIGSVLLVAMADPSNFYAKEAIESLTGLDVEALVAAEPAIRAAIDAHYPAPGER